MLFHGSLRKREFREFWEECEVGLVMEAELTLEDGPGSQREGKRRTEGLKMGFHSV